MFFLIYLLPLYTALSMMLVNIEKARSAGNVNKIQKAVFEELET